MRNVDLIFSPIPVTQFLNPCHFLSKSNRDSFSLEYLVLFPVPEIVSGSKGEMGCLLFFLMSPFQPSQFVLMADRVAGGSRVGGLGVRGTSQGSEGGHFQPPPPNFWGGRGAKG